MSVYLDYAAATPLDPRVLTAMQPYFSELFYNPSAQYLAARDVKLQLAEARHKVATSIGARKAEIIHTAGGTEANNIAIHGVMRSYPGSSIVISAIEHDSVRLPANAYTCREASVTKDGTVSLKSIEQQISDDTVLVSVMHANNEVGTVQPLKEIVELVQRVRKDRATRGIDLPLYVHSDACQTAQYLDIHVARLGIDLLTINGGKLYGPKQSGILYVRAGTTLEPYILGGGQERSIRSGTENVPAIFGFARALTISERSKKTEVHRLKALQKLFFDLLEDKVPQASVTGSRKARLPNNVHLIIPGTDNERIVMMLDEAGFMVATGSACSASSGEPSHVLKAMGFSDEEAQSSLRISMGRMTTEEEVRRFVDTLATIVA